MRLKTTVFAASFCVAAACGDSTAPELSERDVRSAPTNVVINRQSISIASEIWLNLMPSGAVGERKPMNVTVSMVPNDAPVTVERIWVTNSTSIWSGPAALVFGTNHWVARDGPNREVGSSADVIAQVRAVTGETYLIRAAGTEVRAAY